MLAEGPLDVVARYDPRLRLPDDAADFWARSLAGSAGAPVLRRVDHGLVTVETFDVTFAGAGGAPVHAWLHLPAESLRAGSPPGTLPGVVQFQGYNGGRGLAHEHTFWAAAGYAHLVVDTRGQGSGWTTGATSDPVGSGPSQPGFLTRGIGSPETYYYRRAYVDAVRAVEVLAGHALVDPARVVVSGVSQGGGLAIAAAALAPDRVAAVMSDVPFLCDFRRAASLAQAEPYLELVRHLAAHRDQVEQAFATLAYFDGAALAQWATAPALFSVAMRDVICPPSTVFAAVNAWAGQAEVVVHEFNGHEGGEAFQRARQLAWLPSVLKDRDRVTSQ